jgi:hypothetical protein
MDYQYDLFEILPDGSKLWHGAAEGRETALERLRQLANKAEHPVFAMSLKTREVLTKLEPKKQSPKQNALRT